MINSLLKDSHITQSTCHLKSQPSERSAQSGSSRSVALYSSNINVNKKTAEPSFSGFFSSKKATKPAAIYTSKMVKKFLEMAADKPAVFSAAFTIGITCILRPAAIMALPADKKNADDKKYAAAQSISSGLIGYAIALAIFNPISNAFKKITDPEGKFIKREGLEYLRELKGKDAAGRYISMLPETLLAAPRAMVTVALIPPILKYVFGWEKKKTKKNDAIKSVPQEPVALNSTSQVVGEKKAFQEFKGGTK